MNLYYVNGYNDGTYQYWDVRVEIGQSIYIYSGNSFEITSDENLIARAIEIQNTDFPSEATLKIYIGYGNTARCIYG